MAQADLFSQINNTRNISGAQNLNLPGAATYGGISSRRQLKDMEVLLNTEMQLHNIKKKNYDIDFKNNGLIKGLGKMMQNQYSLHQDYNKSKKSQGKMEKDLIRNQKMLTQEMGRSGVKNIQLINYLTKQSKEMEYQVRLEKLKTQQLARMLPMGGRLAKIVDMATKGGNILRGTAATMGSIGEGIHGLFDLILAPFRLLGDLLMKPFNTFLQMQSLTGNLAADIGLTSKESYGLKDNFASLAMSAMDYGGSMEDVVTAFRIMSQETGKNKIFDSEQIKALTELAHGTGLGMEGATKLLALFDNMGISFERGIQLTNNARSVAAKYNLNSTKLLENMGTFTKQLNGTQFKSGIEGLTKIVAKAQSLRFDLSSIGDIANKLFDPEGAIEMSAQLQVMGGKFAQMADPFELMFMAQNDPAKLADKIMDLTKGMAVRGKDGIFSIPPAQLKIIKSLAETSGLPAEQMINAAQEQGKLMDVMSSSKFLRQGMFSEEDQISIKNLTTFDPATQEYVIRMADGSEKALKDFTSRDQFDAILKERAKNDKAAIERKNWSERLGMIFDRLVLGVSQAFVKVEGIFNDKDLFARMEKIGQQIGDFLIPMMESAFNPEGSIFKFVSGIAGEISAVAKEVSAKLQAGQSVTDILMDGLAKIVDVITPYMQFAFGKMFQVIGKALPEWLGGGLISSGEQMIASSLTYGSVGLEKVVGGRDKAQELVNAGNQSKFDSESHDNLLTRTLSSQANLVSSVYHLIKGDKVNSIVDFRLAAAQQLDAMGGLFDLRGKDTGAGGKESLEAQARRKNAEDFGVSKLYEMKPEQVTLPQQTPNITQPQQTQNNLIPSLPNPTGGGLNFVPQNNKVEEPTSRVTSTVTPVTSFSLFGDNSASMKVLSDISNNTAQVTTPGVQPMQYIDNSEYDLASIKFLGNIATNTSKMMVPTSYPSNNLMPSVPNNVLDYNTASIKVLDRMETSMARISTPIIPVGLENIVHTNSEMLGENNTARYTPEDLQRVAYTRNNEVDSVQMGDRNVTLSGTIKLETPAGNTDLTLEDFKKAGIHLIANAITHEQNKSAAGYGLNDSRDIKTTLAI